jgi:hypothetical protein
MSSKTNHLETLVYLLLGGILIVFSQIILEQNLSFFSQSLTLESQAEIAAYFMIAYGSLFLLCALISFFMSRKGLSFTALWAGQLKAVLGMAKEISTFVAERCPNRAEIIGLLAAILLGIGVRAFFLGQPMRMDEAYTFLYYLNQGRNPFYYTIPNNHVLHSLLAWSSVAIGGMGPVAIRFPAFLVGVLSIPLAFFVGRMFNKNSGLLAALGAAIFPYLILYSTMARGYSLIVLLTLLLLLLGKYYLERPSLAGCIWMSIISALGMLTMPTMLFVLAGFYPWLALALFIKRQKVSFILLNFILPSLVITTFLTIVFYTPVVISSNGAQAIFSNQFVDSRSWSDFSKHLVPHLQQILADFSRGIPRALEYAALLLLALGLFSVLRTRDWAGFLLFPLMLLGGGIVLFAKQVIPFVRTWIYLLPAVLLFIDLGYSFLAEKLQPKISNLLTIVMFAASFLFAGFLISTNVIPQYDDIGSFPEGPLVAQYLKPLMTGDEYIVVKDTANYPVFYYLCYHDAPPQNQNIDPRTAKRYFIVQSKRYTLGDLTDEPAEKIAEFGDAVIYASTGGIQPVYMSFMFDCRNMRK